MMIDKCIQHSYTIIKVNIDLFSNIRRRVLIGRTSPKTHFTMENHLFLYI